MRGLIPLRLMSNSLRDTTYFVFQNQVDAAHIAAINRLTDTVVGNIVFFVGGKQLFLLQILSLYLIKQIGIHAVFDIIQHSFR